MRQSTQLTLPSTIGWLGAVGLVTAPFVPLLRLDDRSVELALSGAPLLLVTGAGALCALALLRGWNRLLVAFGTAATGGALLLNWSLFTQSWDLLPSPLAWGTLTLPLAGALATLAGLLRLRRAG